MYNSHIPQIAQAVVCFDMLTVVRSVARSWNECQYVLIYTSVNRSSIHMYRHTYKYVYMGYIHVNVCMYGIYTYI